MTRWLPFRLSVLPVAATLAVIAASAVADPARHPVSAVLLSEIGLVAIYGVGLLTRRIGAGNIQTERLLVELEQTRGAEVRAAALAERQRLAREMHDVLAHSLSGLALQLAGARLLSRIPTRPTPGWAAAGTGPPPGPDRGAGGPLGDRGAARRRASRAGAAGRAGRGLRPGQRRGQPVHGDGGGAPADRPAPGWRSAGDPGGADQRAQAREAERVEVVLGYQPDGVELTIEDFAGPGGPAAGLVLVAWAAAARPAAGYGLTGMRERAELLGGTLRAGPHRRRLPGRRCGCRRDRPQRRGPGA